MPNQTLPWQVKTTPKIRPGVPAENWLLVVHGYVVYEDILGNRHITRFYRHHQKPPDGKPIFVVTADDPPEYNEVD